MVLNIFTPVYISNTGVTSLVKNRINAGKTTLFFYLTIAQKAKELMQNCILFFSCCFQFHIKMIISWAKSKHEHANVLSNAELIQFFSVCCPSYLLPLMHYDWAYKFHFRAALCHWEWMGQVSTPCSPGNANEGLKDNFPRQLSVS